MGCVTAKPAAVVHLDLDGARAIYRVHRWTPPAPSAGDPLFISGLERFLDFFGQAGVTATLFVIAEDLSDPAKRDLLREAVRLGHEIASHSVTHRWLSSLPAAEKRTEISDSRARIADALGVDVDGFRAPGFRIDRQSLELIAESGYAFDSSVFPGHAARPFTDVDTVPATPFHPLSQHELMELPLPSYAPLPVSYHPSYSLVLGNWYFGMGLKRTRKNQAPLVLLFHLTDLSEPMGPAWSRGWRSRLFTLSHLDAGQKRRRCQAMLSEVARYYQLTTTRRLLSSASGNESNPATARSRSE